MRVRPPLWGEYSCSLFYALVDDIKQIGAVSLIFISKVRLEAIIHKWLGLCLGHMALGAVVARICDIFCELFIVPKVIVVGFGDWGGAHGFCYALCVAVDAGIALLGDDINPFNIMGDKGRGIFIGALDFLTLSCASAAKFIALQFDGFLII